MENQTLVKDQSPKWRQPASLKSEDLKENIQLTINMIEDVVKKNNLIMISSTGYEIENIQRLLQFNADDLSKLSKCSKKRIVKMIYKLAQKLTLRKINRFIGFVCKSIPSLDRVKIIPSKQENVIIDLRDKYKKVREEFFKVKTEFKNSKKEFHSSGKKYFY